MKNLILVLLTVVTFGISVNAQDLSYKTFDQIVKPEGKLVATENWGDRIDYHYHKWDEYSLTISSFVYLPEDKSVIDVKKQMFFFDELDFENVSGNQSEKGYNLKIYTKKQRKVVLNIQFSQQNQYTKGVSDYTSITLNSKKEADELMTKLKEKAFDMGLELDLDVERVSMTDSIIYNQDNPDGISYSDYQKAQENNSSESSVSSDSSEDKSTEETSVSYVSITLKHTGGERYYLLIQGVENEKCRNEVFSFTHSKYGEETRKYTFCEGQQLKEKNTGRVIFTAAKEMNGTTYKIN